jgi:hypothetical protein
MDFSLAEHVKRGDITLEDAELRCYDKELLMGYMQRNFF